MPHTSFRACIGTDQIDFRRIFIGLIRIGCRLTFSTGEVRLVDFTPLMQKGICRKLQDLDYFKSFRLDPFTVDWNDEVGFAPRYLYERGIAA